MSAVADKLSAIWDKVERNINSRGLPERLFMFGFAVFSLWFWGKQFLLEPLLVKQRNLSEQALNQQKTIVESQNQLQELAKQMTVDPDAPLVFKIKELKEKIEKNDRVLGVVRNAMVNPQQMVTVLNDLAKPSQGLRLTALKSLPSVEFNPGNPTESTQAAPAATAPGVPGAPVVEAAGAVVDAAAKAVEQAAVLAKARATSNIIYRHGVEVVVTGSYLDLLEYIYGLENSSFKLLWGDLSLVVEEYPRATLTVKLYTLSTDKTWLGV